MSRSQAMTLTFKVKAGLLVAAILIGLVLPRVTNTFILGLITLSFVFALFAMSIDLMAGYAGLVTLGHAGVLGMAMYGVGYIASKTEGGVALQLAVGFTAGMVASAIFGLMAMRSTGVYFIMVTIAQGMIVWGLASRLATITGAENGLLGIRRPVQVEGDITFYYLAFGVLLICSWALYIIVNSPFGYSLKGLRGSEMRVRMLGHNSEFLKFYMFMVSGFFATIAGILLVYLNEFVSPSDVILGASAIPVLMAILGGIGTLIGPVIGAFIIVFLRNWVSILIERWPTIMGTIFILNVLFARDGLVGAISSWWNRRIDKPRSESPRSVAQQEPLKSG